MFLGVNPCQPADVLKASELELKTGNWIRLTKPQDGAVVRLSDFHIGIYLAADGGMVVHSHSRHGVKAQHPAVLRSFGHCVSEFYLPHSWPTS